MNNRLLHNMLAVIALGLMAQEVSAGSWAEKMYPELTKEGLAKLSQVPQQTAPAVGREFTRWNGPSSLLSLPSPSLISSVSGKLPSMASAKSFVQGYVPSTETLKAAPGNVWSGITSRAGSLYEMRPKSWQEAGQMASALPGQTYDLGQTFFAYPGRAAMSAGSGLGSLWSSYAPQMAQKYAGQVGSGIGSGLGWAGSYAPQTAQKYAGQAYNWLANMTEEQKQAAVGLAAVLAAGLAAKKGYDYYRGPSAYNEFTISINEAIAPMLIAYAIDSSRSELIQNISNKIAEYQNMINGALMAGTLSPQEADNLLVVLSNMKVQRMIIADINTQINKLNENYTRDKADNLYNTVIARSAILTPEQKNILREKVRFIFKANLLSAKQ